MIPFRLPELLILFVVALLIFGPKRLPDMGRSIGQTIQMFKKGMSELNQKEEATPPITTASQQSLDAAKLELAALEIELANKKAAATAQEVAQPEVEAEHAETATHVD